MPENDVARVARPGATVFIKPKRARPFFGRHPWVLDSAILRVDGNPDSGAIVDVVTHDGSFIARGLWNASSRIRVRLYSFMQDQSLDEIFWDTRIENAVRLRKELNVLSKKTACRLINSEGDDLSGVIVVALLSSAFARASEIALMLESTDRTELAFPETALATPKPPE